MLMKCIYVSVQSKISGCVNRQYSSEGGCPVSQCLALMGMSILIVFSHAE
jgi:hypothetical protein